MNTLITITLALAAIGIYYLILSADLFRSWFTKPSCYGAPYTSQKHGEGPCTTCRFYSECRLELDEHSPDHGI